ncbi:hypothetical protein STEG23_022681 [Scotinomys teguina]
MKSKASSVDGLGDIYGFKTIKQLESNAHFKSQHVECALLSSTFSGIYDEARTIVVYFPGLSYSLKEFHSNNSYSALSGDEEKSSEEEEDSLEDQEDSLSSESSLDQEEEEELEEEAARYEEERLTHVVLDLRGRDELEAQDDGCLDPDGDPDATMAQQTMPHGEDGTLGSDQSLAGANATSC